MGERRILYAIAESSPFDILLVREMRTAVDALVQLNLRRFRVPQQGLAKYSALDIVKQALELLFEFSPSEKNYREAIRTIRVYSEGDGEMFRTIQASFRLMANAVYNAYTGQRYAEELAPKTLFLRGVPFENSELQKSFRFVGVRPPDISPSSVERTVFLDEEFEPYRLFLEGKATEKQVEKGREQHWTNVILKNFSPLGKNLIRAAYSQVDQSKGLLRHLRSDAGSLASRLNKEGVELQLVAKVANVNHVYGK